jgi:ATP-dependent DNA helicase RecG
VVYRAHRGVGKSDLKDLTDGFESLTRRFPLPKYAVGIVHGRMAPETKDYEMERFKKGETSILVSTTVIEVGVDVPNASVMVVENAERFGLSQLAPAARPRGARCRPELLHPDERRQAWG